MDPNKQSSNTDESKDDLDFLLAEVNKVLQEIERLLAEAEEKKVIRDRGVMSCTYFTKWHWTMSSWNVHFCKRHASS